MTQRRRRTPEAQVAVVKKALAAGDASYQQAAEGMKKLVDAGWQQQKIAEEVGTTQPRVSRLLRALDYASTHKDVTFGEAYAKLNNPPTADDLNPTRTDQARRVQQVRQRMGHFIENFGPDDIQEASQLLWDLEQWTAQLRVRLGPDDEPKEREEQEPEQPPARRRANPDEVPF